MDFPCNGAVSPQSRHALTTNLYEAIGRHFFWALGRQFQRAHVKRPGSRRMSGPTGGGGDEFRINKLIEDIHPRKTNIETQSHGGLVGSSVSFSFRGDFRAPNC